jgi:hypothetical protein
MDGATLCEHKLEIPILQYKDGYSRTLCSFCRKVYKNDAFTSEITIETDCKIIKDYFSQYDQKFPNCTYHHTGGFLTEQFWKRCHTCYPNEDFGVCIACAESCHKDHKLGMMSYGEFYCDCLHK